MGMMLGVEFVTTKALKPDAELRDRIEMDATNGTDHPRLRHKLDPLVAAADS